LLDFCADLPRTHIASGEVLIEQGQAFGRVFLLVEGVLSVERNGATLASITTPGAIVGEMSVLMRAPATASVRASSDAVVIAIEDGEGFMSSRGEITVAVARTLATRLDLLSGYLSEVKRQYGGRGDHLGMLDQVLGTLINDQLPTVRPGSARMPETDY